MDENRTHRRWYQFRLSTVLVLVAICAWTMAKWPFWSAVELQDESNRLYQTETLRVAGQNVNYGQFDLSSSTVVHFEPAPIWPWKLKQAARRLRGPAILFCVLLVWKWTWPRVVRWRAMRRERQAHGLRGTSGRSA